MYFLARFCGIRMFVLCSLFWEMGIYAEDSFVYPRESIKQYSMHGNFQKALSSKEMGAKEVRLKAPATLICPANIPHQLINIGDEPTDQILLLGIGSEIADVSGNIMQLPWR